MGAGEGLCRRRKPESVRDRRRADAVRAFRVSSGTLCPDSNLSWTQLGPVRPRSARAWAIADRVSARLPVTVTAPGPWPSDP